MLNLRLTPIVIWEVKPLNIFESGEKLLRISRDGIKWWELKCIKFIVKLKKICVYIIIFIKESIHTTFFTLKFIKIH